MLWNLSRDQNSQFSHGMSVRKLRNGLQHGYSLILVRFGSTKTVLDVGMNDEMYFALRNMSWEYAWPRGYKTFFVLNSRSYSRSLSSCSAELENNFEVIKLSEYILS